MTSHHFSKVRFLVNKNESSDSFAKPIASHYQKKKVFHQKILNPLERKLNCLYQVFVKLNCSLYMKERLEILKALVDNTEKNTNQLK